MLIVPKKDGRGRPCVDFRLLNKYTRKNTHPLSNVYYQIQKAVGHVWFTTIDLADGFWQVDVAQESIEKTAFSRHNGHYEWLKMPFGLGNAPQLLKQ